MSDTVDGMQRIRNQVQETSKRIKRLGESSQEIGDIVELINGIAEQTNILALNAAIQSASAGGAGRGFAVVADEVQRLAERATNATRRIELLVQNIQTDTSEAVVSILNRANERWLPLLAGWPLALLAAVDAGAERVMVDIGGQPFPMTRQLVEDLRGLTGPVSQVRFSPTVRGVLL